MNIADRQYLRQRKQALVDGCKVCKGLDLTHACYQKYFTEVAKVEANVPIKYRMFTLEDIKAPESAPVVSKIKRYVRQLPDHKTKGLGVYLWGNTGNAKTALASIVLMAALEQGYTAYFTDLMKCMDSITEGWNDEDVKADFIKRILNSEFLVIDDVGREYKSKSGFTEAHFDMIFRERANNLLPTILTSNLAPSDIATDYGKRLLSIFYEHVLLIETNQADYRRKVLAPQHEKEVAKDKD